MSDKYHTHSHVQMMKSWIVDNYDLYIQKLEQFLIDYPVDEWNHYVVVDKFYEEYSFYRKDLLELMLPDLRNVTKV